jgi:hypothetical protein
MRRLLFTLAAATSTLLFAAICLLWLRSHFRRDYAWAFLPWPGDATGQRVLWLNADTGNGQLEISWKIWPAADREQLRQRGDIGADNLYHRAFPEIPPGYARSDPPTIWNAVGFKYYTGASHTGIWFPYWFATLLTATPPTVWTIARTRRRRREKAGRCLACGYDLRATPDRCPECGAVPTRPNTETSLR